MYLIYCNTDNLFSLLQIIHSDPVHQKRQNLKKRIYQVSSLHVLPYSANILNFMDLLKLILILKKINFMDWKHPFGNPRNLQPLKILRCTVEHDCYIKIQQCQWQLYERETLYSIHSHKHMVHYFLQVLQLVRGKGPKHKKAQQLP